MLPSDHEMIVIQKILAESFQQTATQSDAFTVQIVWGVSDLDRSEVSLWDPEDRGSLIWDKDFTIEPVEN